MKLRLYHRPWLSVAALAVFAVVIAAVAALASGWLHSLLVALLAVYTAGFLLAAGLAVFAAVRERQTDFPNPERVLIVSPHQDDCVLMAGAFAARNIVRGGTVDVVYLTQPNDAVMAATRRAEAVAAWRLARLDERRLHHWSVIPAEGAVTCDHVRRLAETLQPLVDAVKPGIVFVPLFEGGHLHHDIANHVVTRMLTYPPSTAILQCPEYSPYFSLKGTPEAALSHLLRWLSCGLAAYYPRAEGVGTGAMRTLAEGGTELALKRRMLSEFRSQNGDTMAQHHGYAERVVVWEKTEFRASPFRYEGSRPWLVDRLSQMLPRSFVRRLVPGEARTIGLDHGITDLSAFVACPAA